MSFNRYRHELRLFNGAHTSCIVDLGYTGSNVVCFFHPETDFIVIKKLCKALNNNVNESHQKFPTFDQFNAFIVSKGGFQISDVYDWFVTQVNGKDKLENN